MVQPLRAIRKGTDLLLVGLDQAVHEQIVLLAEAADRRAVDAVALTCEAGRPRATDFDQMEIRPDCRDRASLLDFVRRQLRARTIRRRPQSVLSTASRIVQLSDKQRHATDGSCPSHCSM